MRVVSGEYIQSVEYFVDEIDFVLGQRRVTQLFFADRGLVPAGRLRC